jgi:hypothetical protein
MIADLPTLYFEVLVEFELKGLTFSFIHLLFHLIITLFYYYIVHFLRASQELIVLCIQFIMYLLLLHLFRAYIMQNMNGLLHLWLHVV